MQERLKNSIPAYIRNIDDKLNTTLSVLKFSDKSDKAYLRYLIIAWLFFLVISFSLEIIDVNKSWKNARGYEYQWISESIARGNGFSFPWNIGYGSLTYSKANLSTAHEEPLYPALLAVGSKLFGKKKGLLVLILHIISLFLTSIVIYHLARKVFNPETGIVAGTVLPLLPFVKSELKAVFVPSAFAGLLISICVYLFLCTLEKPSLRKGLMTGTALGFSCLVYAPVLAFIPLSVLLLLISKVPWKTASAVLCVSIIVISPWTIRNYVFFNKVIPVKTGFGKIAFESNPILASTYSSFDHGCQNNFDPPWNSPNARAALMESVGKQHELVHKGFECVEKGAGKGIADFNEADWNSLFLKKTINFMTSQPALFIEMTYYRLLRFFTFDMLNIKIISVFFGISAALTLMNRNARALTLFGLVYSATYLLAAPYWYRYRYPIEPIFLVLASYLPVMLISRAGSFFRNKL